MIKWLLSTFNTPSAFENSPSRYLLNQLGHAYVLGGLPVYFGLIGIEYALVLYFLWEILQILFAKAQAYDSFEDVGHFTLVALAAHFLIPEFIFVQLLFLLSGYFRRVENKKVGGA